MHSSNDEDLEENRREIEHEDQLELNADFADVFRDSNMSGWSAIPGEEISLNVEYICEDSSANQTLKASSGHLCNMFARKISSKRKAFENYSIRDCAIVWFKDPNFSALILKIIANINKYMLSKQFSDISVKEMHLFFQIELSLGIYGKTPSVFFDTKNRSLFSTASSFAEKMSLTRYQRILRGIGFVEPSVSLFE